MQKKVAFVNLRLTGGGSEKVMSMLASYYADSGIDTTMILLQDAQRVYSLSDNVKTVECYCPMKGNKLIWHIKRILSIRHALKIIHPDTVISFMWDINIKVLLASIGLKAKVIISERADPNNVSRKRSMRIAQKWIFPLAGKAVFQTEQVMKLYPENIQKKGVVIPNPIPQLPAALSEKREKTIVAAGRLFEQKNFSMLVQAFALFSSTHPEYTLKIFGEGKERENLAALAQELGVADRIFLPGFVSNVDEQMRKAAIYASSSNFEGISNAMLEALAMGIPSVCTDCPVGGAAMAIEDHVNGILVKVGDYKAMANAFSEIADNPDFSEEMSRKAIERSRQFSIENIAEKWLAL